MDELLNWHQAEECRKWREEMTRKINELMEFKARYEYYLQELIAQKRRDDQVRDRWINEISALMRQHSRHAPRLSARQENNESSDGN